ncbi:hypothetical protein SCA6_000926 [Theobroma cacao]
MQAVPSPSHRQKIISAGDSGGSSNSYGTNLYLYRNRKRWYRVGLLEMNDHDEQVALLLDMLKCICLFQAYITYAEAQKFREVKYIAMVSPSDDVQSAKQTMSGIFKIWSRRIQKKKNSQWYKVCLVDDKTEDDQVALLLDMLKCDQSEIRSIYKYHIPDLFKARMSEEEADKVAGSKEVEFVEPLCYAIFLK